MATTRSQKKAASTRKQIYRQRVKASKCRGRRGRVCNKTSGCKYATGTKRSFCRKNNNRNV